MKILKIINIFNMSFSLSPIILRVKNLNEMFTPKLKYKKSLLLGDVKQLNDYEINNIIIYNSQKTTDTEKKINIQIIPKIEKKNLRTEINDTVDEIKISNFKEEIKPKKKYKYHIKTSKTNLIKLPEPNYGTDEKELKEIIDIMNEEPIKINGYQKVINETETKIYKKTIPGYDVVLIKTLCKIPYNKDIIFEAISNLELRKKWDTSFSELKLINKKEESNTELLYMIIKSPSVITKDRDNVQQRKIWKNFPNKNSHIIHFMSVDSPEFPKSKKYIRANTIISGYFIEDIPGENNQSILGIVSQTDVGGPNWLINKIAPKASKNWINSLINGCKMISEK